MEPLLIGIFIAAVFWLIIFGLEVVSFWPGIVTATSLLAIWSLIFAGPDRRTIFHVRFSFIIWGTLSAVILYLIFWLGNEAVTSMFAFAADEIKAVYSSRTQLAAWKIGLLLFFLIGPAEEIFWRGFVQRRLANYWGENRGWLSAAAIYAAVHLWSANIILILAALTCGLFWGWVYKRSRSLWPAIISHSVWDIMVFLMFPF